MLSGVVEQELNGYIGNARLDKTMKTSLAIILIFSLIMFCCSGLITLASFSSFTHFYDFTLPFMLQSFVCSILALFGLIIKRLRLTFLVVCELLFIMLYVSYKYAISQWPGGDDGGGMAWLFLVGNGSVVCAVIGIVIAVWLKIKKLC